MTPGRPATPGRDGAPPSSVACPAAFPLERRGPWRPKAGVTEGDEVSDKQADDGAAARARRGDGLSNDNLLETE